MKNIIRKFLPISFLNYYRNRKIKNSKFSNKTTKEVFTEIYKNNHWSSKESKSGEGSQLDQTKSLSKDLEKLFADLQIRSILDIPCGDFKWMQHLNLSGINYIGADIVDELITNNINQFTNRANVKFKVIDLIRDPLPQSDLIIVRDCLVHLSFDDIIGAINNIKLSKSKYLLTTTFTNFHLNSDMVTGEWRPINLQDAPFNLSLPKLVINENFTGENGEFKDKSMALWEIEIM
jgi:SAM-dependent methyltransferase